jgi:hypothetical protein
MTTIIKQQAFAKDLNRLIKKYLPTDPTCANDFTPILDALAEVKERLEKDSMRYAPLEDELDDMSDRYRP